MVCPLRTAKVFELICFSLTVYNTWYIPQRLLIHILLLLWLLDHGGSYICFKVIDKSPGRESFCLQVPAWTQLSMQFLVYHAKPDNVKNALQLYAFNLDKS